MTDVIDESTENKRELNPADLENQGRRKAVKTIIGGVTAFTAYHALPVKWNSPIIEQIFLPAHAATSGSSLHDPCAVEIRGGDDKSADVMVKVTGFVTPPVANLPVLVTATADGGTNQKVDANTRTSATGTFEVYITVGGGPGITGVNVTTTVTGADGVANCVVRTIAPSSSTIGCSESSLLGDWSARGTNTSNYPVTYFTLVSGGIATNVRDGNNDPNPNGSWSLNGNTLTLIFPWFDPALGNGTNTYVLTLNSNCSHSGTGTVTINVGALTESMGAAAPTY